MVELLPEAEAVALEAASAPAGAMARAMVGKLTLVLLCNPASRAFCTKASGVLWSLTTTASPPSS